jgi:pimeloyl-ACP methyl ester carboxylesterase
MPFLQLPDVRLSFMRLGPPHRAANGAQEIVFLHGLAASLAFWYLQIAARFAATSPILLFDLRGHGRSSSPASGYTPDAMADDLHALLDHVGVAEAHLVGHSFGGSVALHFACRYPRRVKSLTLADVRLRTVQRRLEPQARRALGGARRRLAQVGFDNRADEFGVELFERLARLRLERPLALTRLSKVMPTPFSGANGDAAARRWLDLLEQTTAKNDFMRGETVTMEALSAINLPVLLIYGEHSQALPTGQALHGIVDNSRLVTIPRAGHFFPISRPDAFNSAFAPFIQEHGLEFTV